MKTKIDRERLERQKTLIYDFYKKTRRMPSYAEICDIIGVKSKDTAYKVVQKLISLGYVGVDDAGKILPQEHLFEKRTSFRTPLQMTRDLVLLGLVDAGFGALAEQEELERISLDSWLLGDNFEKYFMLKVKGDSMRDAGILDGDMVIVRRSDSARDGDIVIASIDGEWTIKYLRTKNGKKYLQPANSDFKDLHPKEDLHITAVLSSVVRKYE